MILATASSCPFCHTVFSVTQEELLACQGWVRCGHCDEIFNATQQAMDVPQVAPAAADADSPLTKLQALPLPEGGEVFVARAAPVTTAAPAAPAAPEPAEAQSAATAVNEFSWNPFLPRRRDAVMVDNTGTLKPSPPRHVTPSPEAKNRLAQQQSERPAPPVQSAPSKAASTPQQRAQAVAALASASSAAARSAHSLRTAQARYEAARRSLFRTAAPTAPRPGAASAAPLPDFLRRWRQAQLWSQPAMQWAAQTLCALLLFTAAWQWMTAMPQWMAARFPSLQPLMVSLCRHATCRTNPAQMLRRVADIEVSPGELTQRAPGVYELHATIFNRANLRLAMPSLQLTLFKDRTGNEVLLRRAFSPKELGLAAPALAAQGEQKISLSFKTDLSLSDAAGSLTPFYP